MRALTASLLSMALLVPGARAEGPSPAGAAGALPEAAAVPLLVRQEGMVLMVEGRMETQASPVVVWQVLTDYTRFPEFVPGILSNQLLAAGNGRKTLAQRGQVLAGQVRMNYEGTVVVTEHPRQGLDIVFLSGPFKDVRGSWRILAGKPLKLSYSMRMDLSKAPFPPPLAPGMAQQQVSVWVAAIGREIERRTAQ